MCILLCAEITCVSTRKTDNLHVELVSDVVAYSILDNNNNSEEEVDNNNSNDNEKPEETKPQMTAHLIKKIVKQYKSHRTQQWNVADMVADTPPFFSCICHHICLFLPQILHEALTGAYLPPFPLFLSHLPPYLPN